MNRHYSTDIIEVVSFEGFPFLLEKNASSEK